MRPKQAADLTGEVPFGLIQFSLQQTLNLLGSTTLSAHRGTVGFSTPFPSLGSSDSMKAPPLPLPPVGTYVQL